MNDASSPPPEQAEGPLLFSLDGKPAPPELLPALEGLSTLGAGLLDRLDELITPNLEPLAPDQLDNRIARLCRRNDLDPDKVGPAIKATVFLFRQAAMLAVEGDAFGQDLMALGLGQPLSSRLVASYDAALPELRREAAQATIAAHGKVLVGIEWRIDTVGSSNRGQKLNVPVALLTLLYRDGDTTDRVTVQALPDMVASLREICEHLLGGNH